MPPAKKTAILPGSFDPITFGHLDVIKRVEPHFERLVVAVAHNYQKNYLLSVQERLDIIAKSLPKSSKIELTSFDGLLVDFAKKNHAQVIIRGLRAISDFEYEFQMALMNRKISPEIETFFLMPGEDFTYVSSRMVKEICKFGGDISPFVPKASKQLLIQKFAKK